ncbi:MAG TPA: YciI family protein [Pyrinomonadaceae bacterium]|nr:YciI family protein [Pyrinomonadaceae bacterium]
MKARVLLAILSLPLLVSLSLAQENKLVQFHIAIVKRGPNWTDRSVEFQKVRQEHRNYVMSLIESGKAVAAGPFGDNTDTVGIIIFRAANVEEAKSWADADPAAKAGHHINEMLPWWSEDVFGKASKPANHETVYFGFLKRGPNRKEGDGQTPEVQELQKAHIANINRLAETKKLVVAGPFGGNGELRGIFVFRVGSLKEAQDLAATDPMIKIDRLRLELHEWKVPAGLIP